MLRAAIQLFNRSGVDGTSVRAIAREAGVNQALISYYFGGKQGLLEELMAWFLENYLNQLELAVNDAFAGNGSANERLLAVAEHLLIFQQANFYLARFVHREMTLDSQLVRELMATYLMKEKYLFHRLIHENFPDLAEDQLLEELTVLQFRDLIQMPFLQPQYLREVYYFQPSEASFRTAYLRGVKRWVQQLTGACPPAASAIR